MIHIKKIVVPVDFSEPSKKAVNYGLSLALEFEALVVINLQGRGWVDRALLGTTAERVIRTATVPVLSLPLPAT